MPQLQDNVPSCTSTTLSGLRAVGPHGGLVLGTVPAGLAPWGFLCQAGDATGRINSFSRIWEEQNMNPPLPFPNAWRTVPFVYYRIIPQIPGNPRQMNGNGPARTRYVALGCWGSYTAGVPQHQAELGKKTTTRALLGPVTAQGCFWGGNEAGPSKGIRSFTRVRVLWGWGARASPSGMGIAEAAPSRGLARLCPTPPM